MIEKRSNNKSVLKEIEERLYREDANNLDTEELISLIIRNGDNTKNVLELSKNLMRRFGRLEAMTCVNELSSQKGMGPVKAMQIVSALELGKRRYQPEEDKRQVFFSEDIYEMFRWDMGLYDTEHFRIVLLNTKNFVTRVEEISVGTINMSLVHTREVFSLALKTKAAAIVLVHNHPAGDSSPSEEDINITKKLIHTANIVGIEIFDHIIVCKNNYFSFKDKNML